MDIPRLDAKSVSVDFVNDAIKHAFLALGYTAATSDQYKAIREFLQGRDVFVSQPPCILLLGTASHSLYCQPFGRTIEHMRRCEPTDFANEGPVGQV